MFFECMILICKETWNHRCKIHVAELTAAVCPFELQKNGVNHTQSLTYTYLQ